MRKIKSRSQAFKERLRFSGWRLRLETYDSNIKTLITGLEGNGGEQLGKNWQKMLQAWMAQSLDWHRPWGTCGISVKKMTLEWTIGIMKKKGTRPRYRSLQQLVVSTNKRESLRR